MQRQNYFSSFQTNITVKVHLYIFLFFASYFMPFKSNFKIKK